MNAAVASRPRASIHESSYVATPTADGWTQFNVVGAKGTTAPWLLLPIGTFMGGYAASGMYKGLLPAVIVGIVMGFILAGSYVFSRAGSLSKFRSRRAPAGTFSVGLHGIRLRNGRLIEVRRIRRLICRNVQTAGTGIFVGGNGVAGGLAAAGAARHLADAEAYVPISFQLELEADGRTVPVVGCLTVATANALIEDVSRAMNFRPSFHESGGEAS
ncbi:hypothetical protein DFR29_1043 [Tahibacter aquaticus]|uniref:Uncharacterized protein n=1 Tax=Tahibacter aquaticus TaxID=520092 RepID=A0A4R6Z1W5_9GAMM|nr:hypothetical protein [Tahibacter aquaticus]TDR45575.1 hypothetical protein DFR29_1043 [Tahibacter aquaticus]